MTVRTGFLLPVELHLLPDRELLETNDTFLQARNIGRRRIGRVMQEVLSDPDSALDGMGVHSIRSGKEHGCMSK